MIFFLKTQAGWRETNRTELTGADGKPIEHSVSQKPIREYTDDELLAIVEAARRGRSGGDTGSETSAG